MMVSRLFGAVSAAAAAFALVASVSLAAGPTARGVIGRVNAKLSKGDGGTVLNAQALFARGQTFERFLERVSSQRALWMANATRNRAPDVLVARLIRASQGLQFLIVAEDWCPDSVNTVPFVVGLAKQAHVPLRVVDRVAGRGIMDRHRSDDGRTVTPVIVVLRGGVDVAAWVERPAPLQKLFHSMGVNPSDAVAFATRQRWYDADGGQTALVEIVRLVEGSHLRR